MKTNTDIIWIGCGEQTCHTNFVPFSAPTYAFPDGNAFPHIGNVDFVHESTL